MSTTASLTPQKKVALAARDELERRKRRREQAQKLSTSLREFIRAAWPVVEPARQFLSNWHIDAIAAHLQAVTDGQIQNLLINIPPGHAKSLLVSVLWPAWIWTAKPQWRSLFASYAGELSIRDSVRCRALIDSPWYQETFQPTWKLSTDQNQKSYFLNTESGFRIALGVGGKGTGFRGDARIVDDPLNAKDQFSDAALEGAIFWWDHVMSSRLNDLSTGASVIIMQRLSQRDLSGHVIDHGGYEKLILPTEYEPERKAVTSIGFEDPRTQRGELLFPGLFPREVVDGVKTTLGSSGFAGQHQQRPSPAEGGMFKRHWWRYWKPKGLDLPAVAIRNPDGSYSSAAAVDLPDNLNLCQSWDMAFKDTNESDYVVGQTWGGKSANCFLVDMVRGRWDFPETLKQFRLFTERHPKSWAKYVEDKANGSGVIAMLKHEIGGIVAVNPEGGKEARAAAASPLVEAGNVYLPHPALAPWVQDFVDECASFPTGAFDDQVDAFTQAIIRISTKQVRISVI